MKIQIINGPNINLLGKREPSIYGSQSFDDYLKELEKSYPQVEFTYYQSNVEGGLSWKSPGPSPAPGDPRDPAALQDGPADTSEPASWTAVTTSPPVPCRTKDPTSSVGPPTQGTWTNAAGPRSPQPTQKRGSALPEPRGGQGTWLPRPLRPVPSQLARRPAPGWYPHHVSLGCPGLLLGPPGQCPAPHTVPSASPAPGAAPTAVPDGR